MPWDLTSVNGVQGYLARTPFAADNIVILSGGNANFTYRVCLSSPYTTQNGVTVSSVVLKHAEPFIATMRRLLYSTERQGFESKALRHVPELTAPPSKASVPEVFYEDKENRVLIMTDCGRDSTTLKALYRGGPPSLEVCQTIGHALGTFLARLHVSTRDGPGSDIKKFFEGNEEGRRIIASVTYGALFRILGSETSPGLFDPPITLSPDQSKALAELSKTMYERITTESEVLAMGDFWPGNIVISLTPELHCTVIDWETSRPGIPGLEIGQFLGEMLTLRSFHPSATPAVEITVSAFLDAYRNVSVQSGLSKQHLLVMSWDILTRCGTHMVVVTPEVGWGGNETTREVAVEGLEYIFHGIHKNVNWLQKSILKDFIS